MSARNGWNIISQSYQAKTTMSLEDVHYGPISPGESELKLLGNVKGKNILEIGCGGGQNSIVLAKWGAKPVGLDISEEQIKHARKLAKKERVNVAFYVGNMEDLSAFMDESFDIVLSSFAIDYIDDFLRAFQETFRVLRKSGLFIFAVVHPIAHRGRVVRYGRKRMWAVGNYFDRRKRQWKWRAEKRTAKFNTGQRTLQDYFDLLVNTGFSVERILEPEPYNVDIMSEKERKKIPYAAEYYSKYYDIWSKVPYTIIFKTRKPRYAQ
ncbi:MAG TPA: class I SAM-dependent methyltransferase [Candidatus Bathyarchaeia archaeon]|nr:class I SAM-dependent methyltransferase [Candidatus Bathyarchaeia archaeon]